MVWPVYLRPLSEIDFWKQIYTGRYISFFHQFPHHATFTFSPAKGFLGRYAYNWLGNLFLYYVYEFGDYVILFSIRLLILTIALLVLHSIMDFELNSGTLVVLVVFAYGIFGKLLFRNVIFSVVLLPLLFWILFYSEHDKRYLWIIPLLFLIWGNIHGNHYLGLGIFVTWFVGRSVDSWSLNWSSDFFGIASILVVTFLTVAVAKPFLDANILLGYNPQTKPSTSPTKSLTDFKSTLQSIPGRITYYYDSLVTGENNRRLLNPNNARSMELAHPLTASSLFHVTLNLLLLVVFLVVFLSMKDGFRFELFLPFIFVSVLGLLYLRLNPFISLCGFFLVIRQLTVGQVVEFVPGKILGYIKFPVLTAILILVFLYSFGYRSFIVDKTGLFVPYYSKKTNPTKIGPSVGWGIGERYKTNLPEWILEKYPKQQMVNSYTIGAFLIWKWWPFKQVFVDSKISAYKGHFTQKLFSLSHDMNRYYRKENLHYAVYEKQSDWVRKYFRPSSNWFLLNRDGSLVVFQRRPLVVK